MWVVGDDATVQCGVTTVNNGECGDAIEWGLCEGGGIFAGIYFHYFANLKGFVIFNSTCSVLLSYICQLELNRTLHVKLNITKPFKLAK